MLDDLLTPEELAKKLGVKLSTIYNWVHIEYIPTIHIGRLIRFRSESIRKWLEKKESRGRKKRRVKAL